MQSERLASVFYEWLTYMKQMGVPSCLLHAPPSTKVIHICLLTLGYSFAFLPKGLFPQLLGDSKVISDI